MNAKEQKIKEAYGEYWEEVKDFVNNDGWVNSYTWIGGSGNTRIFNKLNGIELKCLDSYHSKFCYYFQPKSLQGIEDNNGWIKIESESDLPKEYEFYDACAYDEKHKNDIPMFYGCNLPDLRNYFDEGVITHYQPVIKRKPPIY